MLSSSDNEESEDKFVGIIGAVSTVIFLASDTRKPQIVRDRIDWDNHVQMLIEEDQFNRTYWMSYESFVHLCQLIHPHLKVSKKMAIVSTGKFVFNLFYYVLIVLTLFSFLFCLNVRNAAYYS